ncbi:hypothetical protein [Phnomibacter ginsenosidimutans]|uniref:Uncharacterized protein n=1 Tax=Phnomibacter ginsenosidimutans TaxID=2676868 RepID=A0A6I6G7V7_9BACT|nr:hypothetical protein [Phnomibacter ginsenosidimutans]QGW28294.1 hypothetical protein GLV81_09465 [Phnomibacter ginsenosidimutans]
MKNKSLFLAIPALLLMAIAIFAFSKPQPAAKATLTEQWFKYQGNINGGGTTNPANFEPISAPSCSGDAALCAIHVLSDGEAEPRPDETALLNMQTEINNAVSSGTPTSDVALED